MLHLRGYTGVAIIVAAQFGAVAACTSSPDGDGSGGSSSGGGPTGGASNSGGGPASGGQNGCEVFDSDFDPNEGECGLCTGTLEDFCGETDCSLPDDLECREIQLPVTTIFRGCGHTMKVVQGDLGDDTTLIWSDETENLVYVHSSPGSAGGVCHPERVAGEAPECDDWEEDCGTALECDDPNPDDDQCACEESLEDFCAIASCAAPETLTCGSSNFSAVMFYRGCGYLHRSSWGEDESSKIWSEETGELVFYQYESWNGATSCTTTIGEAAACEDWEEACDGMGGGGAGGEGGGP